MGLTCPQSSSRVPRTAEAGGDGKGEEGHLSASERTFLKPGETYTTCDQKWLCHHCSPGSQALILVGKGRSFYCRHG